MDVETSSDRSAAGTRPPRTAARTATPGAGVVAGAASRGATSRPAVARTSE